MHSKLARGAALSLVVCLGCSDSTSAPAMQTAGDGAGTTAGQAAGMPEALGTGGAAGAGGVDAGDEAGAGGMAGDGGAGGAGNAGSSAGAPVDEPLRTVGIGIYLLSGAPESRLDVLASYGSDACELERIGGCDYESCPSTQAPGEAPTAGPLRVSGDVGTLTAAPSATGTGYEDALGAVWAAGPIRFEAEGDTLPAFDVTLPAPPAVAPPTTLPSSVPRDAPLVVEFSASGAGTVVLAVVAAVADAQVQLRCFGDAATGRVEVPATLLSRAPAGPATVAFGPESRSVFAQGPDEEGRVIVRRELETSAVELQ